MDILIKNITHRIRDRLILHRYIYPFIRKNRNRKITPENTICVFSQPRSGSTWLAEILNTIPQSCYFDEPLLRSPIMRLDELPDPSFRKFKAVSDLQFYFEQPIPNKADWPEAFAMFHDLLTGQQLSIGLYEESGLNRLPDADKYIIKFNYGNLLMSWLLKRFDVKAILLMRHPCAVIASQLKMSSFSRIQISTLRSLPSFRYDNVFLDYSDIYYSIRHIEEYLAFRWSLAVKHNLDFLSRNPETLLVHYENLVSDYPGEIDRLFNYLNMPIPDAARSMDTKPSASASIDSVESIQNGNQVIKWQHELTDSQVKNIYSIVDRFGIDYDKLCAQVKI